MATSFHTRRGYLTGRSRVTAKPTRRNVVSNGPIGLEIAFATKELRKLCESETKARSTLDAVTAERLKHRIADLLAAANVTEVPRVLLPASGSNEVDVELANGVYLSFRANHNRTPTLSNGGVDWSQVKRIQIMKIGRRG